MAAVSAVISADATVVDVITFLKVTYTFCISLREAANLGLMAKKFLFFSAAGPLPPLLLISLLLKKKNFFCGFPYQLFEVEIELCFLVLFMIQQKTNMLH